MREKNSQLNIINPNNFTTFQLYNIPTLKHFNFKTFQQKTNKIEKSNYL